MKDIPSPDERSLDFKIQMNADQALTLKRKSTHDGDYTYKLYRKTSVSVDFLGEWDQDSAKEQNFQSFDQPHEYTLRVITFDKLIRPAEEEEKSYGLQVNLVFGRIEVLIFKMIRQDP